MRTIFKTSYDADINLFQHGMQAFWYLGLLAVMVLLPFVMDDFALGEMVALLIWAIAGMGLMILVGQTGQASLGHAAFLAVGCYANVLLQEKAGLPFILSFPLAGLIAGIAGALIAMPMTKLHGIYLGIGTLAISILTDDLIVILEPLTNGVRGLYAPVIDIFGVQFDRYGNPDRFYWLVLFVVVCVVLVYRNLRRSVAPSRRCVTRRCRRAPWASTSRGPRRSRSASRRRSPGLPARCSAISPASSTTRRST
jgi:branched-chain amino acid transport system permease protein